MPDGSPAKETGDVVTSRKKERRREDDEYLPVIIKRTDERRRHPDDTLENAIEEGLEQINRPALSLNLSSFAAGLIVGFSPMAVAVVTTAMHGVEPVLLTRIATAFVYPLGFVICVLSGAQLFTEHTATAVYPLLDRKVSIWRVLRLWLLVIMGNLTGAACSGWLLMMADEVVGSKVGYVEIGHHLVGFSSGALLVSAMLGSVY